MINPAINFKEEKYIVIENFITPEFANFLYEYVKMSAQLSASCVEKYGYKVFNNQPNLLGLWSDPQADGCYSKYGDPAFDTLLKIKTPVLAKILGLKLLPTYSYHRLYTKGAELLKHTDRPSCQISSTMTLGYNSDYNWPMCVGDKKIELKPGDCIIYRGCEVEHWREKFTGTNHAQVFFHWNEDDGKGEKYDGREHLGLPNG